MNPIFKTYLPPNFSSINAYIFAENANKLIEFYTKAFYAVEINRSMNPKDGTVANVILTIGESNFMVSEAKGPFKKMRAAFYLYVNDVDALHKNAIQEGGKVEFEPTDMPYGDRQSGIIDPNGNYRWISKRLSETPYD